MTKSKRRHPERDFTPTHPNAAAIDIGSRMHVAAVPPDRDPEPVRAFGTCTGDLQQLANWFERCGVRTVAMESTGVYWIPAYEMLEQRGFEVVLGKEFADFLIPRILQVEIPLGPTVELGIASNQVRLEQRHPTADIATN